MTLWFYDIFPLAGLYTKELIVFFPFPFLLAGKPNVEAIFEQVFP